MIRIPIAESFSQMSSFSTFSFISGSSTTPSPREISGHYQKVIITKYCII